MQQARSSLSRLISAAPVASPGRLFAGVAGTRREPRVLQFMPAVDPLFGYDQQPLVQNIAPGFNCDAVMPDNSFEKLNLSSYRGKHVILFFYPLDFTFVCPSELVAFDEKLAEFTNRDCEVIGVSVDSAYSHRAWKETPLEKGGVGPLKYPLVADLSKDIARSYRVLSKDRTVALRGVVRASVVNDLPLGRSVDEALRMVDALQHFEKHGEVCPADWQKGKKAMTPTAAGVADYLSSMKK